MAYFICCQMTLTETWRTPSPVTSSLEYAVILGVPAVLSPHLLFFCRQCAVFLRGMEPGTLPDLETGSAVLMVTDNSNSEASN